MDILKHDRLQAGACSIAFETGDGDPVFSGLREIDPANRKFLIVVRGVLLILNMLTTHNLNPPDQAAFAGISQGNIVVTRLDHIDFIHRPALRSPVINMMNALPFAEFFHPAFLGKLGPFGRSEMGQDFGSDARVNPEGRIGFRRAVQFDFNDGDQLFGSLERQIEDGPAIGRFIRDGLRLTAPQQVYSVG